MSAKVNPVIAQRSTDILSKHLRTTSASCILCRVLCPRVLAHRHVLLDYSEAKTVVFIKTRQANYTCAG
jgi:hypothetical protein